MGMAELADEELSGVVPTQIEQTDSTWTDVGFYIGEDGRKHWGVIKKSDKYKTQTNWDNAVNMNKHSSDPRYMETYE